MRIINFLLMFIVCVAVHARTYDIDIVKMDIPDDWKGVTGQTAESNSSIWGKDAKKFGRVFDCWLKGWVEDSCSCAIFVQKFVMTDGRNADLEFLRNFATVNKDVKINWVKDKENQWHADFLSKETAIENAQIYTYFQRTYALVTVNGKTGHLITANVKQGEGDAETFAKLRDAVRKAVLK